MPRSRQYCEPKAINRVVGSGRSATYIEIATGNPHKVAELKRLIPEVEFRAKDLGIPEVQSLDPFFVAEQKAIEAWRKNGYNPILVEDTSLEIAGLQGKPGTYADAFTKDISLREIIARDWLKGKSRSATARVILALYDGEKAHFFHGKTAGIIANEPRGDHDFGWDDIFIPDGQKTNKKRTFGEMSGREKDKYSMRKKAVEELKKDLENNNNWKENLIWMLQEPYAQELERPRFEKLTDKTALKFAFSLESLERINFPNKKFIANRYRPLASDEKNSFYIRYSADPRSPSLGLVLTDVDRANIKTYANGDPELWQMGPERRKLALIQRSEYFLKNHNPRIYAYINKLERKIQSFPPRPNRRHAAIDRILKCDNGGKSAVYASAFQELGYRKRSSNQILSRAEIAENYLFNKIGKYPRKIIGLGSMPTTSGQRDAVVTAAIGHMPIFVTRNSLFAGDVARQISLIKEADKVIKYIFSSKTRQDLVKRNIGVSLGIDNPKNTLANAKKLFKTAGVRLFRIYTIGSDPRVIELALLLRRTFGDEIEIFVGQITDKKQALRLIDRDIRADALIFGHGGGRQCTSAINGMAISTMEEVYEITLDKRFNHTSLLVEGGVGTSIGPMLLLVDGVLYNQQLVHGTIEAGDIFLKDKYGYCQPYHGEASPPTQIVESANPLLREKRLSWSGRTNNPEGKPGYMYYKEKANSMAFWIREFLGYAARTLADLGVKNIPELRALISDEKQEFLRIISNDAAYIASPYGESK